MTLGYTKGLLLKYKGEIFTIAMLLLMLLSFKNGSDFGIILLPLLLIGLLWPNLLFPLYFITSLNSSIFPLMPGVGITRVISFILAVRIIGNIIQRKYIYEKVTLHYLFAISAITLITLFNAYIPEFDTFGIMFVNILMVFCASNYIVDKDGVYHVLNSIYWGALLALVFSLYMMSFNPILLEGRVSLSPDINVNQVALFLVGIGTYVFARMFYSDNRYIKLISFLSVFVTLLLLFLTGSRSALIGFIGGVCCCSLIFLIKKRYYFRIFLFIGIAIAFYFLVVWILSLNPLLSDRFDIKEAITSGGTGRLRRIEIAINKIIPEHLFWGVGMGANNEEAAMNEYMHYWAGGSHNFIVSQLTSLGVIGFTVFMSFFIFLYYRLWKGVKDNLYFIIPILIITCYFFNGIGETIYCERFFWSVWALGVFLLVNSEKSKLIQ